MSVAQATTVAAAHLARDIAEAVSSKIFNDEGYSGRTDLAELSDQTDIHDVDVHESLISYNGKKFSGMCEISVTLNYHNDNELDWRTDVFPGEFWGYMDGETPVIEDITVDTSSFFE
jgi:hypothetical protein